MRIVILRPGRSRAAWQDETDPLKTIEREFPLKDASRPELEHSVYVVRLEREEDLRALVIRVLAEHYANDLREPPNTIFALDLRDLGLQPIQEDRENGKFSFTRTNHHFLRFLDVAEMARLVEQIKPRIAERMIDIEKGEILEYAEGCLQADDSEWLTACAPGQQAAKWREVIQMRRNRLNREKADLEKKRADEERLTAKKAAGKKNYLEMRANQKAKQDALPPSPEPAQTPQPPSVPIADVGDRQSGAQDPKIK